MYTLDIDLQKDFDDCLINDLKINFNLDLRPGLSSDDIRLQYFNFKLRLIKQMPRKVIISKEFHCPQDLQKGLDILIKNIEAGNNLYPYLSKKVDQPDEKDTLLYDWGITHFHLGEKLQSNGSGFIERTGPLLFARFDNQTAYLINIYEHKEWSNQEMVRVIHINWPDSIRRYLIEGVKGLAHVPSDNDVALARKHGLLMSVEVDNNVYVPIGGGLASDGSSVKVGDICLNHYRLIERLQDHVQENLNEIGNRVSEIAGEKMSFLKFKLHIDDRYYWVIEEKTKYKRLLFDTLEPRNLQ